MRLKKKYAKIQLTNLRRFPKDEEVTSKITPLPSISTIFFIVNIVRYYFFMFLVLAKKRFIYEKKNILKKKGR